LLDIQIPLSKPREFDHADVHAKTGRLLQHTLWREVSESLMVKKIDT
jgi:hypothetical protein